MARDNVAFRANNAAYYRSVIQGHPLFTNWPNEVLSQFAKLWNVVTIKAGTHIVTEGSVVDDIYFIVEGHCEVIRHDKDNPGRIHTIAVLSPGESIGLSATGLFSKTHERTATVIALSKTLAITIKLKTMQTFLEHHPDLNTNFHQSLGRVFRMQLVKESLPFARVPFEKLLELSQKITEIDVPANTVIFKEGDAAEDCYLIVEGKVEISKEDEKHDRHVLSTLSQPAIFGEMAIVLNEPRNAAAKTLTACQLYRLHRDDLLKLYEDEQVFAKSLSNIVIKRSRPEQLADVIERHETNHDQQQKVVLKNIKNKELFNLNEKSYYAWTLMDGIRSIGDINELMQEKYGEDLSPEVIELITELLEHGFILMRGYRFPKRKSAAGESLWSRLLQKFS